MRVGAYLRLWGFTGPEISVPARRSFSESDPRAMSISLFVSKERELCSECSQ